VDHPHTAPLLVHLYTPPTTSRLYIDMPSRGRRASATSKEKRAVDARSDSTSVNVDTNVVSIGGVIVSTADEFRAAVEKLSPDLHSTSVGQVATSLMDGKVAWISARGGDNDVTRFAWHVSRGMLPAIGQKTSKTVSVFGAKAPDGSRVVLAVGMHLRFAKGRHVYSLVWRDPADAAAGHSATYTIRV
jgi:hypothetical protein